jgi:hypothetical protein
MRAPSAGGPFKRTYNMQERRTLTSFLFLNLIGLKQRMLIGQSVFLQKINDLRSKC